MHCRVVGQVGMGTKKSALRFPQFQVETQREVEAAMKVSGYWDVTSLPRKMKAERGRGVTGVNHWVSTEFEPEPGT